MNSSDELIAQLESYTPFDELEALHVKQLQQFLQESSNPYDRSNLLAHIAADAWIVNPKRDHVVLVEHARMNHWLAPGGHCDGSPDVFAAAMREAEEETGLTNLKPLLDGKIFDINVGYVPTAEKHGNIEPTHLHFDICYAFEAPENAPLIISDESTQLAWVPLSKIPEIKFYSGHYRRLPKTKNI